jgi:preprotein translocase subunit SecB
MDNQLKSVFRFDGYKVDNICFKSNPNFHFKDPVDIDFSIDVNVLIDENNTEGIVTLNTKIFEDADNYPFSLSLEIYGHFSTDDAMSPDQFKKFCEVNGTATLFPFLRSIVSDITKAANIPPLALPLINIHHLIEENTKKNT